MLVYQLVTLFFKTIYSVLGLLFSNEQSKLKIKQRWGRMVVDTLGFEITIKGAPLDQGNYILVGNHISFLDIPLILSAAPQAAFIAKSEIRSWPIIGPAAAIADVIFVDRKNQKNSRALKEQIEAALKHKNKKIVIFPAGTTSLYEERPWKKGIFKLAQENQVRIQLFSLKYQPLRESAYVDGDNLLAQIAGLSRIKSKKVCLTWLPHFDRLEHPEIFAEELRQIVRQDLKI